MCICWLFWFSFHSMQSDQKQFQVFCYICKLANKEQCLTTVEHVLVKMKLKSTSSDFSITLTSPSGTRSLLVNHISPQVNCMYQDIALLKICKVSALIQHTLIYVNFRRLLIQFTNTLLLKFVLVSFETDFIFYYLSQSNGLIIYLIEEIGGW